MRSQKALNEQEGNSGDKQHTLADNLNPRAVERAEEAVLGGDNSHDEERAKLSEEVCRFEGSPATAEFCALNVREHVMEVKITDLPRYKNANGV